MLTRKQRNLTTKLRRWMIVEKTELTGALHGGKVEQLEKENANPRKTSHI